MDVCCTSPWIPPEWIVAHGLSARGIWSIANLHACAVPEGACAFACAAVDLARELHAPFVFTTACDQMRRAADATLGTGASQVFLFNLPATWQTSAARELYLSELIRLGRFLVSIGGTSPTEERLGDVIREFDERRNRLRAGLAKSSARENAQAFSEYFCGSRSGDRECVLPTLSRPPATFSHPLRRPESEASRMGEGTGEGAFALHGGLEPRATRQGPEVQGMSGQLQSSQEQRPRIAIIGGPLLPDHWPLFDAIEAAGGRVALNATEPGERCLVPCFPPRTQSESALTHLAGHYFDHAIDVFHRPDARLRGWLGAHVRERRIHGVIVWCQAACDLWRAQAASLREHLELPVLALDAADRHGIGAREINRVTAFVESFR